MGAGSPLAGNEGEKRRRMGRELGSGQKKARAFELIVKLEFNLRFLQGLEKYTNLN